MPTELERKIETVILAAPTIINEAEHSKNCRKEVNDAINAINTAGRDTKVTALSTNKPLTAEEMRKAFLNPANTDVIDPTWRAAINKLNTDDLFKLTYVFMRYKNNNIPSEPLIKGANLAACKVFYQTYLEKCMQENPPSFNLDANPPVISEKIQALLQLMYKRHLELGSNMPEKAVVVEIYFALYGQDKVPTKTVIKAISEQLKKAVEVSLAPAPGSLLKDLFDIIAPGLSQSGAKTPKSSAQQHRQKIKTPEELNAILFHERLTKLRTSLEKYKKNNVAEEFLKQCAVIEQAFKALTECYKKANYLSLIEHPLLNALSIDLDLAPEQKEKNNLLTLNFGVKLLAKQLEDGLRKAIEKEARKGSGLWILSKRDLGLLETLLAGDHARHTESLEC